MVKDAQQHALLEPRLVGGIKGDFFVPAYQRGYRWGRAEVARLLDDIRASDGEPYYLQPLVVRAMADGRWELVDGQQRLTTHYLILKYIRDHVLPAARPRYTLAYETREGSAAYLESLDPDLRDENIDCHHIFHAHECIREWFEEEPGQPEVHKALDMHGSLNKDVTIIWYEVPAGVDETTLFTRLNVGRIPLTDSELVKALVLSRAGAADGHGDRRFEISASVRRHRTRPARCRIIHVATQNPPTRLTVARTTSRAVVSHCLEWVGGDDGRPTRDVAYDSVDRGFGTSSPVVASRTQRAPCSRQTSAANVSNA